MKKTVRVANASGFWGDDLDAFQRQLTGGKLDYLNADFLAEVTMSILQKQQERDASLGYVKDFIDVMKEIAPLIKRTGVKLITNAGGNNPMSCGKKLKKILESFDIPLSIGVVEGDNIYPYVNKWYEDGELFSNFETSETFDTIKHSLQSASVYSGMWSIVELLKQDVDIVIAGRVADPAMTMAPLAYEFGWKRDDWDSLASALVAGHVLECGAQASGGNYTDWDEIQNWENFGYPIIEMSADGSFIVTKHKNTGGAVNEKTIKEQLLYEISNPYCYTSPDVVVDFTSFRVEELSENRVLVSPAKGYPPTPTLKASMTYKDGFMASGSIIISGDRSVEKAQIFEAIFWKRINLDFDKKDTSYVGFNSCSKRIAPLEESKEVLLKFSVHDRERKKVELVSKKISALILSGPQGVAVTGGRPKVRSVVGFWPALIHKRRVLCRIKKITPKETSWKEVPSETGFEKNILETKKPQISQLNLKIKPLTFDKSRVIKIVDICLARSGDKGNSTNIGLIARNDEVYDFIKKYIDVDFVKNCFKGLCKGRVLRYELDNLKALNFLLESSLNGGGTKSLWIDAQGKTYATTLLNQEIEVPLHIYKSIN